MPLLSWGVWIGVLVTGLVICETVFLHLNVIFIFVCLKRFAIFLIYGEVYVNIAQCVSVPVVARGWGLRLRIQCFSQ